MATLRTPPRPCPTCPYVRSTPPGIWHPEEYAKLAQYDDPPPAGQEPALAPFHCHGEKTSGRPTVCRGWTMCHGARSVAVRYALVIDAVDVAALDPVPGVEVYASGAEAAAAGLAGCDEPDEAAQTAIDRLLRSGRFRT